jgi:hypothetical protein
VNERQPTSVRVVSLVVGRLLFPPFELADLLIHHKICSRIRVMYKGATRGVEFLTFSYPSR